jgi:hypothetical protein
MPSFVANILQSDTTPLSMVPACFIMLHRFYNSLSLSSNAARTLGLSQAEFKVDGRVRKSLRRSWRIVTNPGVYLSSRDNRDVIFCRNRSVELDEEMNGVSQDGQMSLLMHLALALDPCTWDLINVCASASLRLDTEHSVPQSAILGAKLLVEHKIVQDSLQGALAAHVVRVRGRTASDSQTWRQNYQQRKEPLDFWTIQDAPDMQLLPLANVVFRLTCSGAAVRHVFDTLSSITRAGELVKSQAGSSEPTKDAVVKATFNRSQLRRCAKNTDGAREVEMLGMLLGDKGADSFSLLLTHSSDHSVSPDVAIEESVDMGESMPDF